MEWLCKPLDRLEYENLNWTSWFLYWAYSQVNMFYSSGYNAEITLAFQVVMNFQLDTKFCLVGKCVIVQYS